ncbi:MarR family winged helix-turn-helix transcriptional regulator [Pseudaquabacterium rugosum]|uniref:MarR family transcriptional regulator n=1 Tax=Pseudaquabacterium rugosum TaxID=2984194 RepID=A0ABU9B594_9BURK
MMRKKIDHVNQSGAPGGAIPTAVATDSGDAAPTVAGVPVMPATPATPAASAASAASGEDADVFDAVHGLMHALRARLHADLRTSADEGGLTPMEGKTLGFFARHPGATQRELAEHAGRDKAQIARLVAALRDRGLLRAETDAQDRRQVRLYLSGDAARHHAALQQRRRALAARAVRGFSAAERAALLQALARMRGNLDED